MPHNSTRCSISLYENALSFQRPGKYEAPGTPPTREEGDISSFSQSSRRRLIKKMLKLERSRLSDGLFVTLTYHREWPTDRKELKRQLNTFLQSLRRRYPGLRYIWRVELQKRGAPHFHLLLWRSAADEWENQEDQHRWLTSTWQRVSGCTTRAHARHGVDVQRLTSWREALAYTSKYVAKTDDVDEAPRLGRRWGASESLPCAPSVRLHVNERGMHILRRLARKLLSSRGMNGSRFIEHLKQASSGLIGMERRTVHDLCSYLTTCEGVDIRDGPPPVPPSDVPDDAEWVRTTYRNIPGVDPCHSPPKTLQCA